MDTSPISNEEKIQEPSKVAKVKTLKGLAANGRVVLFGFMLVLLLSSQRALDSGRGRAGDKHRANYNGSVR